MPNLPLLPASLPEGFNPSTWQQLANEMIGQSVAQFAGSGFTVVLNQAAQPAAADRDKLWFDTDDSRVYAWDATVSAWVSKHPEAASGNARRIYVGTLVQLQTYDGGDTDSVGDAAGPMWEEDTAFQALFPVGVGTFSNAGALTVGTSTTDTSVSGADEITLATTQIPSHTHDIQLPVGANIDTDSGGQSYYVKPPQGTLQTDTSEATGGGQAHNNLPPMLGVYFIKRTARIYYKGS